MRAFSETDLKDYVYLVFSELEDGTSMEKLELNLLVLCSTLLQKLIYLHSVEETSIFIKISVLKIGTYIAFYVDIIFILNYKTDLQFEF